MAEDKRAPVEPPAPAADDLPPTDSQDEVLASDDNPVEYSAGSTEAPADPVAPEPVDHSDDYVVPVNEPRNFVPSDSDVDPSVYVGVDPEYVRVNEFASPVTQDDLDAAYEAGAGDLPEVRTVTVADTVAAQVKAGQLVGAGDNVAPQESESTPAKD